MKQKIYSKIITIIILLISMFSIYKYQSQFKINDGWNSNNIELNILNDKTLYINKLLGTGMDGFFTTIFEHTYPIDITNSLSLGKNEWLSEKNNVKYIDIFMKLYGYRGNIYQDVFSNIISDPTTNSQNIKTYTELLYNNIVNEPSNNITDIYYKGIYDKLEPLYCDKKYPVNTNFNNLYNSMGLYYYRKADYKKSGCFILLSGFNNKLITWQTLSLSNYKSYSVNKINKIYINDYNNIEDTLFNLAENMKLLDLNVDKRLIHRNTSKTNNIILINQVYTNSINTLRQHYLDIKK